MKQSMQTRPLREVNISVMGQEQANHLSNLLERLHCTLAYMSAGYYLVLFPDGTVEEIGDGEQQTTILLPCGARLTKTMKRTGGSICTTLSQE